MTVRPKPKAAATRQNNDKAAEAFINGKTAAPADDDAAIIKLTLRLSPELLEKIDRAAKRRHINRTAWIKSAISEVLDAQG